MINHSREVPVKRSLFHVVPIQQKGIVGKSTGRAHVLRSRTNFSYSICATNSVQRKSSTAAVTELRLYRAILTLSHLPLC